MSTIVLDADLKKRLRSLSETINLQDESGTLLGRFVPEADYHQMLYALLNKTCPYTEEELDRIAASPGGRTTDQINQRLRSL